MELRKILLTWIVLNDAGQAIMWTDDDAEAEDLRQRIEPVTKPVTKVKHVAQEKIYPRQAYGQLPKWREKEIAEKKKG